MKNYYLLLIAVALFVFACQKSDTGLEKPTPEGPGQGNQEKFAVNIKVPEFTQRMEPCQSR